MIAQNSGSSQDLLGDDVAQEWLALVDPVSSFEPLAYYDRDGDCIEFLVANDSYRAERVDDRLTVYYSRETGEIIGSLIKGVRRLLREITNDSPGFKIDVVDGKVRLQHLISATLWKNSQSVERFRSVTYQKVRDAADQSQVAVAIPEFV